MSLNKSLTILSGCVLCSSFLAAQADTVEKTTTTTTTVESVPSDVPAAVLPPATTVVTSAPALVLPAEISYTVVDGKTGIVLGNYDVAGKVLASGQTIPAGALIVERNSGRLVATIDAMGTVVDVYAAPVTETLSTAIIERRSRLSQMINEALAAGTLTKAQAATLHAELAKTAAETASGTQLTYGKAMLIGYNLDLLSDQLVPIVRTAQPIVPVIPGEFVVVGGRLSIVDKFTYRRIALERRIDDEYKAGRLTGNDVSRLKSQLDQISYLESKYRVNDGQLSDTEQRKLALRLDEVQASIDTDVAHINHKRSDIGLIVE